ncbi:mannose/glucose-specific lectin-like [Rhododendron vialii]|uniref:mannose/glucose-specific lectin-like n=1 Tax=Rhododendron vialii TaxID=182163 RepID=UPI00265EB5E7|nr:mannose/glucose-specific lectin-like [Rhododendron vialii]
MAMISGAQGWVSLGPWGGKGGEYSAYKAEGPIMQITIRHGDVIDSILFESQSWNGNVIGSSVKIGGTGGSLSSKFHIDSSVERLTSISLTYKDYHGQPIITSLCFGTNIGNKYGPFGPGSGASVSIPIEDGFIAGFHGRGGSFLDAIGIFVAPKGNVGNEGGCISLGLEGGKEGAYWAYKADEPIMVISIRYGEAIDSILFQSRTGNKLGRSMKIGDNGGGTTKTFSIDSSVEQISSISLTYEKFYGSGEVTIISLSFETNIGNKYGPFGSRTGTSSVSIPIEGGDFAGFHGRVGVYLTAIGVLVAPKHVPK